MHFTVQRGGRDVILDVTPARVTLNDPVAGRMVVGQLGVAPSLDPRDSIRRRYDPVSAVGAGVGRTCDMLSTTVYTIGRLLQGQESPRELTGVVGIAQVSHFVAVEGARGETNPIDRVLGSVENLLSLVAVISVSIGFANLLPIPILDGGHLLFYAYEAIARRPVAAAVQAASNRVGLAILLGLMMFAITNYLQRSGVFQLHCGPFS